MVEQLDSLLDAVSLFSVDRDVGPRLAWALQEIDQLAATIAAPSPTRTGLDTADISSPKLKWLRSKKCTWLVINKLKTLTSVTGP